jgi:hypothetical protein
MYPHPVPDAPWLGTARLPNAAVLHRRGVTFDLTESAARLASSSLNENQAFAYGPRALALQFHIEANSRSLERWYVGHSHGTRHGSHFCYRPQVRHHQCSGPIAQAVSPDLLSNGFARSFSLTIAPPRRGPGPPDRRRGRHASSPRSWASRCRQCTAGPDAVSCNPGGSPQPGRTLGQVRFW